MSEPVVLIVDDEVSGRDTLEAMLSCRSFSLRFAENGRQALEMAGPCSPDIILLDVMMPDMDGLEVCRRLRKSPATASTGIIMVTALDDGAVRAPALDAGADDVVAKPINVRSLQEKMRALLGRSQERDSSFHGSYLREQ